MRVSGRKDPRAIMERGCGYWFLRYVLGGFEDSCEEVRIKDQGKLVERLEKRVLKWRDDEIRRDDTLRNLYVIYHCPGPLPKHWLGKFRLVGRRKIFS